MELINYLKKHNIPYTEDNHVISVGGWLNLRGTSITQLPDNLSVGGGLSLHEKFQNVAYKKNCGRQNRTIFAAWVNNEIQIGAGCFLGSINKFCEAVATKYSGPEAERYKADAQGCHDRLIEILNPNGAGDGQQ